MPLLAPLERGLPTGPGYNWIELPQPLNDYRILTVLDEFDETAPTHGHIAWLWCNEASGHG